MSEHESEDARDTQDIKDLNAFQAANQRNVTPKEARRLVYAGIKSQRDPGAFVPRSPVSPSILEPLHQWQKRALEAVLAQLGPVPDLAIQRGGDMNPVDLDQGVWFRAACSGLWYRNAAAAVDISAVRVNGVQYHLTRPFSPA